MPTKTKLVPKGKSKGLPKGKGKENFLTRKTLGMPMYVWVVAVGLIVFILWRRHQQSQTGVDTSQQQPSDLNAGTTTAEGLGNTTPGGDTSGDTSSGGVGGIGDGSGNPYPSGDPYGPPVEPPPSDNGGNSGAIGDPGNPVVGGGHHHAPHSTSPPERTSPPGKKRKSGKRKTSGVHLRPKARTTTHGKGYEIGGKRKKAKRPTTAGGKSVTPVRPKRPPVSQKKTVRKPMPPARRGR